MTVDSTTHPPPRGISRRAFLTGGVVVAASTTLVGGLVLRDRSNALARLVSSPGPRLSVGYVEGATSLAQAAGLTAVPAATVSSGDPTLLGGVVRVRIQGMSPGLAEHDLPEVAGLTLDALVPSPRDRTGEVLPFYAWNLHRSPVLQAASPVSFVSSVASEPTLGFRLTLRPEAPDAEDGPVTVFTSGREPDLPRMREGLYLLGIDPDTWLQPTRVPDADDERGWGSLASVVLTVARES